MNVGRPLEVPCPICRKRAPWDGNPFRPFCSERCKLIDLGEWVSEGYRVTAPLEDESSMEPDQERGE
jgi:hypothetical protein